MRHNICKPFDNPLKKKETHKNKLKVRYDLYDTSHSHRILKSYNEQCNIKLQMYVYNIFEKFIAGIIYTFLSHNQLFMNAIFKIN